MLLVAGQVVSDVLLNSNEMKKIIKIANHSRRATTVYTYIPYIKCVIVA